MARLRKPIQNEPTIFIPPSEARATRTSPRKVTRSLRYTDSSSDEESQLVPKASSRNLRQSISQDPDGSSIFKTPATVDALTPRRQRILRPVESNSRLLRKISDESLASPEKKPRGRRIGSGTASAHVGNKTRLMYAKTLAKSVIRKQASSANISVIDMDVTPLPGRSREPKVPEIYEDETMEEAETSILCGDKDDEPVTQEDESLEQSSDDEDPVMARRQRQRPHRARCISSDSEEDEAEITKATKALTMESLAQPSTRMLHRKGQNSISNWTQEVIDLTSSPKAPESFTLPDLPPPSRARTASLASSRPETASSSSALAILSYSPTPTKFRSPCKAPPLTRPGTPPLAPPSPSKLVSPSKKKPAIPKAPNLRPSLDAFWNPEVVNDWNEMHSPSKPLVSPRKQKWREDVVKMMEGIALEDSSASDEEVPSPTTSPRKKKTNTTGPASPTKKSSTPDEPSVKELRAQRKDFAARKHALAESFLTELDTTITDGRISALSASTGGIKLIWSKTLKTTAGRANWRREQIRLRTGTGPTDFKLEVRHHCSIELAEKVIDDETRLYNVLAHEFCHLTTFMISDVRNNPHGAEFKSWGRKVTSAFANRDVEVTTKHSYQIDYRYVWECVVCGYEFKRHSKSVDPLKHSCGRCKGQLVQTKPTPRGAGVGKKGEPKEKSEYQVFVKENFARVKSEMVKEGLDAQMGKVMERLGREYREMKAEREKKAVGGLEDALEGLKI